MDDEIVDSKTRRRLIAATGGAIGLSTLAGCSAEEDGGGGDGDGEGPTRPSPDGVDPNELDPVLLFLVRSHDYQNALLEREFGD